MWQETIKNKNIKLFPGERIAIFGGEFEVIEVKLRGNLIEYRITNIETGAVIFINHLDLQQVKYRRIEDERVERRKTT